MSETQFSEDQEVTTGLSAAELKEVAQRRSRVIAGRPKRHQSVDVDRRVEDGHYRSSV